MKKKILQFCCILILFELNIEISNKILKIESSNPDKSYNNESLTNGRIFICTTYNNEAEMAYVHIWRLYDYVDKFIFVISNLTYSGNPKNVSFKSFEKDLQPYRDKIDIVLFDNICNKKEYPFSNSIWCREESQRDFAKIFIEKNYNPTKNDLLIIVDLDEILTREAIKYIKKNPPKDYYFIKGTLYFPYFYHGLENWDRGVVVRYKKNMKTLTQYRAKKIRNNTLIKYKYKPSKPLLTHCSYCFKNIEEYKDKLKSFSHQKFNKFPYTSNNWIFKSHYCREKIASPIKEYDETYEGWKHLIPDDERLKYLVDPSFMYSLNQTTYSEKDLKNLCNFTYNRTAFELSAKYNSSYTKIK